MTMGETSKSDNSLMNATDKWFNRYEAVDTTEEGVFKGVTDRFNGITIDSTAEQCEDAQFDGILSKSLNQWTEQKRRAIWFKVNRNQASWLPVLAKNDFYFHHARNEFVMMYKWLPKTEPSAVPPFAHTMVGVGALVINNQNQVLVVSEKNALITNSWKLPGGYLEMNENLVEAAIREVLEETNIKTRFESVVSLRHAHGAAFGCSDLYIVMKLIPETEEIRKCDREIAKCTWMNLDEYMNHPNVHQTNRAFVQHYLDLKSNGMMIDWTDDTHQVLKRKYNLFFPKKSPSL
ncbi:CLUMA_CG008479, isoform B [Clunio marinus]|uniref:CLUMA_CG008479, isoform B n=1 Tax=Clunio marinus TaxID=568069 RepID=A0A1J1I3V7_9DIPT|nr:CLUMA_CG008479, isoform B [Clunio marinus]